MNFKEKPTQYVTSKRINAELAGVAEYVAGRKVCGVELFYQKDALGDPDGVKLLVKIECDAPDGPEGGSTMITYAQDRVRLAERVAARLKALHGLLPGQQRS